MSQERATEMEETAAHQPPSTEGRRQLPTENSRVRGGNANSGLGYYLLEVMK